MSRGGEIEYVVKTDLPPQAVTRAGLEVFKRWMEFALGQTGLGGQRLIWPTGRYAASLSFRQLGESTVAIVADENRAPEAAVLETGHGAVDLKQILGDGRHPMHRFQARGGWAGLRRLGGGARMRGGAATGGFGPSTRASVWAQARGAEYTGFATIGPNSAADSWIIPPMPAYEPGLVLSNMIAAEVRASS